METGEGTIRSGIFQGLTLSEAWYLSCKFYDASWEGDYYTGQELYDLAVELTSEVDNMSFGR